MCQVLFILFFGVTTLLSFSLMMVLVAFFMLCERKVLGYMQLRKGPTKVGVGGVLQSFADLLKLLLKVKVMSGLRSWLGWLGCLLLVMVSCVYSEMYSYYHSLMGGEYYLLVFLAVTSVVSYGVLMIGWGGWSKYSLMGSMRASFASVSFEGVAMCVVLFSGMLSGGYSLLSLGLLGLISPLVYGMWLCGMFGETNRVPFDYGESESELVSGLNVEYYGVPFVCIFAVEYFMMYMFSWVTSVLFFSFFIPFVSMLHLVLFVWVRGTFPRVRYDYYVDFMWSCVLLLLAVSLFYVYC